MKKSIRPTLDDFVESILENLEELNLPLNAYPNSEFVHGEKTAFVECLELLEEQDETLRKKLPRDLEKRYPI